MAENQERIALTEAVFYILLSLYTPLHGYGIMQNTKELSSGRVNLGAGTLYGALNTLVEKKWIVLLEDDSQSRKKEYLITELGKEVVRNEMDRLKEMMTSGQKVLEGF